MSLHLTEEMVKQEEKALTKTLVQTTPNNAAFTLIELIVVVALIAIVAVFALPKISTYSRLSLDAAAREMSTVLKEAYNAAVITGRVYRIVYDLKEMNYWAEYGPQSMLLDTDESREKRKKKLGLFRFEEDDKKRVVKFTLDKSITRNKRSLPIGVKFEDILTEQGSEAIKSGKAYTHIFPHGKAEQTLVHLKDDSGSQFTLLISPLLGKARVYKRYVDRKEAETL